MTQNKILADKLALVTGATHGIGRAVAKHFAEKGAHILALGRQVSALESLDDEIKASGGNATLVELDLKDGDAIDRLGGVIAERWGKLDIFIGNAGVLGPITPLAHINPKNWRELMDVNLTANYRLIRSLDPLLRQADAGRVVFVSSGVAQNPKAYWGGYAITKAALEMMAMTYADENELNNLKINILNPGATRTQMRAAAMPGEDPTSVKPVEDLLPLFLKLVMPDLTENGKVFNYKG